MLKKNYFSGISKLYFQSRPGFEILKMQFQRELSRIRIHNPAVIMGFILDGCSFHYAYKWRKSGISICWRHLVTSKESSNPIFFRKRPCFHHSCAKWKEQQSNIKTIGISCKIQRLTLPKNNLVWIEKGDNQRDRQENRQRHTRERKMQMSNTNHYCDIMSKKAWL